MLKSKENLLRFAYAHTHIPRQQQQRDMKVEFGVIVIVMANLFGPRPASLA
jgi:hypothetical protein